MLTSPVQVGDTVVIVASYGGDNRHPTWFLNLRANPEVEITTTSAITWRKDQLKNKRGQEFCDPSGVPITR